MRVTLGGAVGLLGFGARKAGLRVLGAVCPHYPPLSSNTASAFLLLDIWTFSAQLGYFSQARMHCIIYLKYVGKYIA